MGQIKKHPLTTFSGLGALLSYSVEQWAADHLGDGWDEMSWGWIALVLGALWFGAQVSQLESDQHPTQEWWRARKQKVRFGPVEPNYEIGSLRYTFHADVIFTAHLDNVVIRVETFKEFTRQSGREWARIGRRNALTREECSSGQAETINLMKVDRAPPEPEPPRNALADYARAVVNPPKPDVTEGFYRVVITVTAAGIDPHAKEFDFEWRDNQLRPLPLMPSAELVGTPTLAQSDGVQTLWMKTR